MGVLAKPSLAVRILLIYLRVSVLLHTLPLHEVAAALSKESRRHRYSLQPARYSRAVDRVLRIGKRRPRCLPSALVLFRLLKAEGVPADLVVGLPPSPTSHIAHAWVEIGGKDIGPPPGRGHHEEFARYS